MRVAVSRSGICHNSVLSDSRLVRWSWQSFASDMTEHSKIRCGVVGTGYLGQHHARIYAALDECELVGIVEADDVRAAEICGLYDCQRFDSAQALAAACDAVSVVVPTDKHCEVAVPLLLGG